MEECFICYIVSYLLIKEFKKDSPIIWAHEVSSTYLQPKEELIVPGSASRQDYVFTSIRIISIYF